ncbi:MAG TPA: thermonuclease family protein, partial [Micropepsaceae bacterium]
MKTARYGLRLSYTIILTLMLSVFAVVANAAEFTARATGVTDGDTLTVLTGNNESLRIRLVEIDAPESDQPWGANAKQALSALVLGQSVRVVSTGQDEYGRTLARIFVNGKDVNAEMVRTGSAWAYRHYLTDTSLLAMERDAQN